MLWAPRWTCSCKVLSKGYSVLLQQARLAYHPPCKRSNVTTLDPTPWILPSQEIFTALHCSRLRLLFDISGTGWRERVGVYKGHWQFHSRKSCRGFALSFPEDDKQLTSARMEKSGKARQILQFEYWQGAAYVNPANAMVLQKPQPSLLSQQRSWFLSFLKEAQREWHPLSFARGSSMSTTWWQGTAKSVGLRFNLWNHTLDFRAQQQWSCWLLLALFSMVAT